MKALFEIVRAATADCDSLTCIAYLAKGHWGYPPAWMESWRETLTITPEILAQQIVFVAIRDGTPLAFYGLVGEPPRLRLEHLWVRPEWMGHGIGRALLEHALDQAKAAGAREIEIEADPNAEGFYLRAGARKIGEHVSETCGEKRCLPVLLMNLTS